MLTAAAAAAANRYRPQVHTAAPRATAAAEKDTETGTFAAEFTKEIVDEEKK